MTVPFLRSAVCATLLAIAGSAAAQAAAPEAPKFEFHGFVGGSLFTENAAMNSGGGQAAWFVAAEPNVDKTVFGGDVRQTRLNFSLAGPQLWDGATAKGVVEVDFFGTTPAGALNDISLAPRMRLAFAELKLAKSGTTIRVGQDHDLILGIILPTTVGHVAFPLSYQDGTIGWRRPQIAAYQMIGVADMKLELALAIGRAAWNANSGPETGFGPASGKPAFEGRVKLIGKVFEVFVAGHWSQIDTNGQGSDAAPDNSLDTTAITAGGKVSLMGFTLQGAGYSGKNLGPLAGNILQWQALASLTSAVRVPNVSEQGAWAQLGYTFGPWSGWLLTGFANPNGEDIADANAVGANLTRDRNSVVSGLLRWQVKGYTAGLEYSQWQTRYMTAQAPTNNEVLKGNQLMLSGMYFF